MSTNDEVLIMGAETAPRYQHRCNACGKPYYAGFDGRVPSGTALIVTDCADCAPPTGPRLTKFFDARGGRLWREGESLSKLSDQADTVKLVQNRYSIRHMADRVPAPDPQGSVSKTQAT